MKTYDVIVLGVGGIGSATLYELARRGYRVLGIERFEIPNNMGSSHGQTRIIRIAYGEHSSYVPLMLRAYELWQELETDFGENLLFVTGSIDTAPPTHWIFKGAVQSCIEHDLPHEILTGTDVNTRFPGYQLPTDYLALFQPDGGFLASDHCILAHCFLAQQLGAEIHTNEKVQEWRVVSDGVQVLTNQGSYEAGRLVVTAGPWIADLVDLLEEHVETERQVMAWFYTQDRSLFTPDRLPVFNLVAEDEFMATLDLGKQAEGTTREEWLSQKQGRYSGLPIWGGPGFKVLLSHHRNEIAHPDFINRKCSEKDAKILSRFILRYFPKAAGSIIKMSVCIFTNTQDQNFIIDRHPKYSQVLICSACSGHGFKFATVLAEILADFVEYGKTEYDISLHRLDRLL